MKILIPFNTKYLKKRYRTDEKRISQIVNMVIPDLLNRLSSDDRVSHISLVSDITLNDSWPLSTKIDYFFEDTSSLESRDEIISRYLSLNDAQFAEVLVVYNPLFPFISVSKLAFSVKNIELGHIDCVIGSFNTKLDESNNKIFSYVDIGAFSAFRVSRFESNEGVDISPFDVISLSASEIICLRGQDDFELYSLIKNSGFI